jgi:hypothetical protein
MVLKTHSSETGDQSQWVVALSATLRRPLSVILVCGARMQGRTQTPWLLCDSCCWLSSSSQQCLPELF